MSFPYFNDFSHKNNYNILLFYIFVYWLSSYSLSVPTICVTSNSLVIIVFSALSNI